MAGIPTQFDYKIGEIQNLAASIECKLGIISRLRSTPTGDVRVKRPMERQLADLRIIVQDYADAVMALAHSFDE